MTDTKLKQNRGFINWDTFLGKPKVSCSDAHRQNPNYDKRTQSVGVYGNMKQLDQYKVNPKHKITEDSAVTLPLHRKLKQHFAENACMHAMKKLEIMFKQSEQDFSYNKAVASIEQEEEQDLVKKNREGNAFSKMRAKKDQQAQQQLKNKEAETRKRKDDIQKQRAEDEGVEYVKSLDSDEQRKAKTKQSMEQLSRSKEATTGQLIKYVMDCIEKEEKLTVGATGKRRLLSFKEKNKLIRDFLNLRSAPHKNRVFQAKQAKIEDIRHQQEKEKIMNDKMRRLESEMANRSSILESIMRTSNDHSASQANISREKSASQLFKQVPKSPILVTNQGAKRARQDSLMKSSLASVGTHGDKQLGISPGIKPVRLTDILKQNIVANNDNLNCDQVEQHSIHSQSFRSAVHMNDEECAEQVQNRGDNNFAPTKQMFGENKRDFMISKTTGKSFDFDVIRDQLQALGSSKMLRNMNSHWQSAMFSQQPTDATNACFSPIDASTALLSNLRAQQNQQIDRQRRNLKSQDQSKRRQKAMQEVGKTQEELDQQKKTESKQRLYSSFQRGNGKQSASSFHLSQVMQKKEKIRTTHNRNRQRLMTAVCSPVEPVMTAADQYTNTNPVNEFQDLSLNNYNQRYQSVQYANSIQQQTADQTQAEYGMDDEINGKIQIDYSNVLPSKLRHGNYNVMPLMPKNMNGIAKTDKALLQKIIQSSAFTLSQSERKNAEIEKMGRNLVNSHKKESVHHSQLKSSIKHKDESYLSARDQQMKNQIDNVQSRRLVKDVYKQQAMSLSQFNRKNTKEPKRQIQTLLNSPMFANTQQVTPKAQLVVQKELLSAPRRHTIKSVDPRIRPIPTNVKRNTSYHSPIDISELLRRTPETCNQKSKQSKGKNDQLNNVIPAHAFLRDQTYKVALVEELQHSSLDSTDQTKIQDDLQYLEKALAKFKFDKSWLLEHKDPAKLADERSRHNYLKKTAMQKQFSASNEDEENGIMMVLLEESYKTNSKARNAMDQHMHLLDTIAKSDNYKNIEKHMKKSLRQIRGIITEVVRQRKMRRDGEIGGANYNIAPLSKPPNLNEVRQQVRDVNVIEYKRMIHEVHQFQGKV